MLSKLMKYEFKSTARIFLPLYACLIAVSIINRIFIELFINVKFFNILIGLFSGIYIFLIIGIYVLTLVTIIQRFYKSLLSDEGYLSMTLPVKTSSHILSKLIVSFIWTLSTVICSFISIFITVPKNNSTLPLEMVWGLLKTKFESETGFNFGLSIMVFVITAVVATVSAILMIYTAISFGQLSNKHKILTSFGAYIAIYAILQTINMIIVFAVAGTTNGFFAINGQNVPNSGEVLFPIIICEVILQLGLSFAYFFITRHILDKKLNLQ